jgi:hypothetical protein
VLSQRETLDARTRKSLNPGLTQERPRNQDSHRALIENSYMTPGQENPQTRGF